MTKICEYCGIEFDPECEEVAFINHFALDYYNLTKCLCGKCAIERIEAEDDSCYDEQCEDCGCTFKIFERNNEYEYSTGDTYDDKLCGITCIDCAIERYKRFSIRDAKMQIKYCGATQEDFPDLDFDAYPDIDV